MHAPSSGQPYSEGNPGGLPHSPTGDPKKVQRISGASVETDAEFDEALGEFAPLGKKTKSSSLSKDGERVPISLESEGLAKSPYNR